MIVALVWHFTLVEHASFIELFLDYFTQKTKKLSFSKKINKITKTFIKTTWHLAKLTFSFVSWTEIDQLKFKFHRKCLFL